MILVGDEERKLYRDAGLWGDEAATHSLDGLLRHHARENPDRFAFGDAPDRNTWTSGAARSLNWGEMDREVEMLAIFLKGLGLPEDAAIALYGPNTTDMAVCVLAIHRAGFIAAPMPLFWRAAEMRDYLSEVQARAIIAADRVEGDRLALRCRDLAQNLFSMRFVLGFGENLPDGVVNLDEILTLAPEMAGPSVFPAVSPDAVVSVPPAALQSRDTEVALPRSSNQWIAAERALFSRMNAAERVLSPFSLAGFTGFCAGLIRALRQGGALYFHHYRTQNALAAHLDLVKPDLVLLPERLAASQIERFSANQPASVACIWKNIHLVKMPVQSPHRQGTTLFDITVLNEVAALAAPRRQARLMPELLPLAPESAGDVNLRMRGPSNGKFRQPQNLAGGELIATGAGVPEVLFPTNSERRALARLRNRQDVKGAHTHIACRLAPNDDSKCEPIGFFIDAIARFGQVVAASEIDELYKDVPNILDAAHFIDPQTNELNAAVVGNGSAPSREIFLKALEAMGVSPLKMPAEVFATSEIKRGLAGTVLRQDLLRLTEAGKARQAFEALRQASA